MADKPDAKAKEKEAPGVPGAADKPGSTPAEVPAQPKARIGALKPWLPVLLAIVVAPATCWAVAELVLLPRLQQQLAAGQPAATEAGNAAGAVTLNRSMFGPLRVRPVTISAADPPLCSFIDC